MDQEAIKVVMDQGALEGAMDDTSDGSEKSDGWYK
jgi:hypothetical protein